VIPVNIAIDSATIMSIVAAAFLDSGGLNAGTPFETASTPVIAVHPFANADGDGEHVIDQERGAEP
jgi:hypothetical protein